MINANPGDDLTADFLQSYERKGYEHSEAAQYEREQAQLEDIQRAKDQHAEAREYLKGLGLGDTIPSMADYDYGAMLGDGVYPRPNADGHLPLPARYWKPGRLISGGFDLSSGQNIDAPPGTVYDRDMAIQAALADGELTPQERNSLEAWYGSVFTGERFNVAGVWGLREMRRITGIGRAANEKPLPGMNTEAIKARLAPLVDENGKIPHDRVSDAERWVGRLPKQYRDWLYGDEIDRMNLISKQNPGLDPETIIKLATATTGGMAAVASGPGVAADTGASLPLSAYKPIIAGRKVEPQTEISVPISERKSVTTHEMRNWDPGPRGTWENITKQGLMALGLDEGSAGQQAKKLMSGEGSLGFGLADFDPMTIAFEARQALERGDYFDAALMAIGLAPYAKPVAKAAKAVASRPSLAATGTGIVATTTSEDVEASWLSKLARTLTANASRSEIAEGAKIKGSERLSEETIDNVWLALRGRLNPVEDRNVGPVTVKTGDGKSHGYYYMAANEDRVRDVMAHLKITPTGSPTKDLDAVFEKWRGLPARIEFDPVQKANRVYFGITPPGQISVGMLLDANNNAQTMFYRIYEKPKVPK